MNYTALEETAAELVIRFFESPGRGAWPYHNLAHTKAVVQHTKEIAQFYKPDEEAYSALVVAAWFHDTGQLNGEIADHEQRSVVIMHDLLSSMAPPSAFIEMVSSCILITKRDRLPATLPEKIICDADTYHFGTPVFRFTEKQMQQEMEMRSGCPFPYWHQGSLQYLKNHVFYTEYCQLLLGAGKQENMAWLETLIRNDQQHQ